MHYQARKVPVALSGLMLGTFSLGNLMQLNGMRFRYLFGSIATVLLVMMIQKIVCHPRLFWEEIKKPIPGSVLATFPMSLSLFAGYIEPFNAAAGKWIWYLALMLHILIMLLFTGRFVIGFNYENVYTSYFIVYVGIAVNGIVAPQFGREQIGYACFLAGFVFFVIWFVLILWRYCKHRTVSEEAWPLICIFAAPASLCLASYLKSASNRQFYFIIGLAGVSLLVYLAVLLMLPRLLRLKFYPSYAAFTFPFVISATAIKLTVMYLAEVGREVVFLQYVEYLQTGLAFILVVYTLLRYFQYLFISD